MPEQKSPGLGHRRAWPACPHWNLLPLSHLHYLCKWRFKDVEDTVPRGLHLLGVAEKNEGPGLSYLIWGIGVLRLIWRG